MKHSIAKLAAVAALPIAISTAASAQSMDLHSAATMSYSRAAAHTQWHDIMLISGILLLAGLVDDNGALILVGGAGVLVALTESGGNAYRSQHIGGGLELAQSGPFSFGFNPFGQMRFDSKLESPKPSFVLQAKFKF